MGSRKNICNYVHFPMQSGSNDILKRMNRTYTKEHFRYMADKIREIMPNCGLSTDIIVGFPGETDKDFGETLDLMNKIKFNSAFTFKYSPRPYTKAQNSTFQHRGRKILLFLMKKVKFLMEFLILSTSYFFNVFHEFHVLSIFKKCTKTRCFCIFFKHRSFQFHHQHLLNLQSK